MSRPRKKKIISRYEGDFILQYYDAETEESVSVIGEHTQVERLT